MSKIEVIKRIRFPEVVEEARKMVDAGADPDIVLVFMRDRGLDIVDCIYSIQALLGSRFGEAKGLVIHSHAWSDRYESDTRLREAAREAFRILAESKSKDLPRIIIEDERE